MTTYAPTSAQAAGGEDDGDPFGLEPEKKPRDIHAEVVFWRQRVKNRKEQEDYKEWEHLRKEAKNYYAGKLLDESDIKAWQDLADGGYVVQNNMWRRIQSFFVDAIFSAQPNIAVRPTEGRQSDQTLKNASTVENWLRYVWRETKQRKETKRVLKDGWSSNIAAAKVDYDRARGLFRMRWLPHPLIVDPECHGDLSRAMWIAEEVTLPALRILQDETFPVETRKKLAEKWQGGISRSPAQGMEAQKTLWYVYSREGTNPLGILDELTGQAAPVKGAKKKLIVVTDDLDEFLYEEDDPCPYLDEDEYPVAILCLDEQPGEWFGSPTWKMLKSLIDSINWLVSFYVTDMKKKATDIILVNKAIYKGQVSDLTSASHMSAFLVDGDPNQASARLNIGKGDMTTIQGAEALHEWLARISGFNEVAQGESSGRKTAEEARYLQQNTSLVTKGSNQALDDFIEECARLIGLASLYYIPQFSWAIGPDGTVMTQAVQAVPVMDPMGMPAADPQTGQPVEQMQAVLVPVDPEKAKEVGAVRFMQHADGSIMTADELMPDAADLGMRMPETTWTMTPDALDVDGNVIPGVPMFQHAEAGKVLRRGIDFFLGAEQAMNWPVAPLEDVKRDLMFSFEAGSTRADFRYDQQQAAIMALNLLGPIYQQTGAFDQLYELLVTITKALPLANTERLVPPRDQFLQNMQAAFMAAQQAQAMGAQQQQMQAAKVEADIEQRGGRKDAPPIGEAA